MTAISKMDKYLATFPTHRVSTHRRRMWSTIVTCQVEGCAWSTPAHYDDLRVVAEDGALAIMREHLRRIHPDDEARKREPV